MTDGISLDVLAGETHAIIGPNGAGKTTLIHQISGALAPDAGRIIFDGRDITHLSMPARAQLGLARSFQITHVLPRFTALENVALAVQARSGSSFRFWRPAAREEALNAPAMEALEVVELAARAHTPAGTLSHGEKRRLEIAIALAQAPKLLLLDEPMAGAGAEETHRLVATLKGLKRRYTIVLVEHDMQAVFALADRISVLVEGRIIATGDSAGRARQPGRARRLPGRGGMSAPLLAISGLEAGYGESQVLFGVDLAVGAGEVVSLMGRNGMGKTTTVRALMGLLPVQRGPDPLRGPRRSPASRPSASPRPASASCRRAGRSFRPSRSRKTSSPPPPAATAARKAGRWSASTPSCRGLPSAAATSATRSRAASSRCWRSAAPS